VSRVRARLARLERVSAKRPPCPACSLDGPVEFVVAPPRVIGEPVVEAPPRAPTFCGRCGRPREHLRFVVRPPRQLGRVDIPGDSS